MQGLETRGMMEKGKREEIENWMGKNGIKIAGIQETRVRQNQRENKQITLGFLVEKTDIKETTYQE